MNLKIPFSQSVITGAAPVTTNTAITADFLNMALAIRVYVVVLLTQAVADATVITLRQAKDNTGTGLKDLANTVPVHVNEDVAASDALVKETDAISHTVDADIKKKLVVFQVEGEDMDVGNDFTHLTALIGASGQATNIASVMYVVEAKEPGETMID